MHIVINSVPTTPIFYGTNFLVSYTGNVSSVALMTPNAATHGTEMAQRLFFPLIIAKTANYLTIQAPIDPTILLQGYIMLFLNNGDTPSIAQWIRLATNPNSNPNTNPNTNHIPSASPTRSNVNNPPSLRPS